MLQKALCSTEQGQATDFQLIVSLILVDASLKYTHLIPDNIVELLLHDALKYIDKRKTTIVPNGFGKWWLGNLVTMLGGNWEQYPCRGDITSYSLENETTLMIWQNTAWGEQEGVRRIIEEKLSSIKVYFQEEEPGCELYATNSFTHFPERYLLDSYEEPLYFVDIEEAAKCVADIVGHSVEPSVEAIDLALDDFLEVQEDNDTWYGFHEFIEDVE